LLEVVRVRLREPRESGVSLGGVWPVDAEAVRHRDDQRPFEAPELEQFLAEELRVGLRFLPEALDQAEVARLRDHRHLDRALQLGRRLSLGEEVAPGG
jgi:hypothetical protein